MWPAPYTETFIRTAQQGTTQWTVPAGRRALVTDFACMNFGAAGSAVWVIVAGIYVAYVAFPAQNTYETWSGLAVAYPGQTLAIAATVPAMHCTLSGKLLSDTGESGAAHEDAVWTDRTFEELRPPALYDDR